MNSVHFFSLLFLGYVPHTEGIKEWGEEKRYFRQGRHYIQAKGGMKVGISISYVARIKHLTFLENL